jgi:ribose-phosphate pyrophosphokinase
MKGILHINSDFSYVDSSVIQAKFLKFPGGESHIQIEEYAKSFSHVIISARIQTGDHIMQLALAKDALDRMRISRIELVIPYLPYARQDRVANSGESLSLKVMANMINAMKFDLVTLFDVHSDVATALLDNSRSFSPLFFVNATAKELVNFHLVFPDAGATKKYQKIAYTYNYLPTITCSKHRDTVTGKLDGFSLGENPTKGSTCLIVDDICDGGRTFIEIAKLLKSRGAEKVYLFVTHGIFSNGFMDLLTVIDGIYCTNSFSDISLGEGYNFKQFKISI